MNKPPRGEQKAEIEVVLGAGKRGSGRRLGRLAGFALVAAALLAGAWYYFRAGPEEASLAYVTEQAAKLDLVVKVTATGSVQPRTKVDISSEMSGIMRKVLVDYNSSVKVGDVLGELDRTKLQASVEAARARLAVTLANVQDAQVALEEKKLAYERKLQLSKNNYASKQDLDVAKAAYDRAAAILVSAHANVDQAKAELQLQQTNLERTRIVSPIDGVVLMRKVDPGQTVASSLQAPVLFTIAEDLTKMEAQVDVDEADVGKVKEGMTATFSVDAYPNRRFDAVIRTIRYGSEVVQGVVTYKAVLATDNRQLLLRPGMTATAEIIVQTVKDALTVPNQALRFSPPRQNAGGRGSLLSRILPGRPRFRPASQQQVNGPNRRLWVLREGKAVPVSVTIGPSDGKRTHIVAGGLRDGDAVIVDTETRRR